MKHLQKIKKVVVRVFYVGNGHFKESKEFNCALDAKHFVEKMANNSKKPLQFFMEDEHRNSLYVGNGLKVV